MTGKPDITELDKIVGHNVKQIREEKRVSQEKLAEIIECSPGLISLLEQGKRAWNSKWIFRVSEFFKISPNELYHSPEEDSLGSFLRKAKMEWKDDHFVLPLLQSIENYKKDKES